MSNEEFEFHIHVKFDTACLTTSQKNRFLNMIYHTGKCSWMAGAEDFINNNEVTVFGFSKLNDLTDLINRIEITSTYLNLDYRPVISDITLHAKIFHS